MTSMSQEILDDIRVELQRNSQTQMRDMENMIQVCDKENKTRISELDTYMRKIVESARVGSSVDFSKLDLSPVLDEIRSNEVAHSQDAWKLQQRFDQQLVGFEGHLQVLMQRVQKETEQVQLLSERVFDSEKHLSEITKMQSSMHFHSTTLADEAKQTEQKRQWDNVRLAETLENISSHLQNGSTSNNQSVLKEVKNITSIVYQNNTVVLTEIARIQQAMQLDFMQMLGKEKVEDPEDHALQEGAVMVAEQRKSNAETVAPAQLSSKRKRIREYWSQTDLVEATDKWTQTDPKLTTAKQGKKGVFRKDQTKKDLTEDGPSSKSAFADADALKKKARAALVNKPEYKVTDLYHLEGFFQMVARSPYFDYLTLFIVCVNAVWIAIDIDNNPAAFLNDADPFFAVVDLVFCAYFFAELCIRFMAFANKFDSLRDFWFSFDSLLVFVMVLETWILPIIILATKVNLAGMIDLSMLKMVKMVKLLRLSRLAKILRAVPELMIVVKGIGFASRSVAVFSSLWTIIIYVFAILLRQLTQDEQVGKDYFPSVLDAMNTLLLNGIIPDQLRLVADLGHAQWYLWPIIVLFVLLCSLTIMYMLVGVLVDVVGVIAASEKENSTVGFLVTSLREHMDELGYNSGMALPQYEFTKLLLEPAVARTIASVGVDIVVLIDMLDVIYEDSTKIGSEGLSFENIVDIILNMRGANPATVKDVKEQLRVTKQIIQATKETLMRKITEEFAIVNTEIKALRDEAVQRDQDIAVFEGDDEELA